MLGRLGLWPSFGVISLGGMEVGCFKKIWMGLGYKVHIMDGERWDG